MGRSASEADSRTRVSLQPVHGFSRYSRMAADQWLRPTGLNINHDEIRQPRC
ncbi:hypothetical protein ACVWXL_005839 [Bradyrhizobium sp. GM22.5]